MPLKRFVECDRCKKLDDQISTGCRWVQIHKLDTQGEIGTSQRWARLCSACSAFLEKWFDDKNR